VTRRAHSTTDGYKWSFSNILELSRKGRQDCLSILKMPPSCPSAAPVTASVILARIGTPSSDPPPPFAANIGRAIVASDPATTKKIDSLILPGTYLQRRSNAINPTGNHQEKSGSFRLPVLSSAGVVKDYIERCRPSKCSAAAPIDPAIHYTFDSSFDKHARCNGSCHTD
jgi:hypothetical protein